MGPPHLQRGFLMAFLPLFSGTAYPKDKHCKTVTLMAYTNPRHKPPCTARKYCYIVKRGDLQKIFANAGITLKADQFVNNPYWNRDYPNEEEYAVEICQDDNGDPVYIVYERHHEDRNRKMHKIYLGEIKENEAVKLDVELKNHDISGNTP